MSAKVVKGCIATLFIAFTSACSSVAAQLPLTIEEQRIARANVALTESASRFDMIVDEFEKRFVTAEQHSDAVLAVQSCAEHLWAKAVKSVHGSYNPLTLLGPEFDDRSLYWARLKLAKIIRSADTKAELTVEQRQELIWQMERASRGQSDIDFAEFTGKKILITGFDPFFLDRNIGQSNPSGLAALYLDNKVVKAGDQQVMIQSAIFPVRFEDFDYGEVERFLQPFLKDNSVDMIVTISMGRDNFDLERFPGLRRSAEAPDNLNVLTGASNTNPLIPMLGNKQLNGPEFVEFSLPVKYMTRMQQPFAVNDNHQVTTLKKTFEPDSLDELTGATSVSGSGGGYLSNEISYRSINLRNQLGSTIPVGHLHTPRVSGFDPEQELKIVKQIEDILVGGMTEPE